MKNGTKYNFYKRKEKQAELTEYLLYQERVSALGNSSDSEVPIPAVNHVSYILVQITSNI